MHGKQSTVYAFASEIDAWLEARGLPEGASDANWNEASPPINQTTDQQARESTPIKIAILPIRNLHGNSSRDGFADGMTDELISEIGHASPNLLRVIAFTSVMRYRDQTPSAREIGQELGVDYILEASIRRYGRRVRLTARLIATRDQAHIWGNTYEIQLPPIFSIQQDLTRQVVDSLFSVLRVPPPQRPGGISNPTVEAHDAYIEGRSHFLLTEGDIKKSIEQLNLAIARDPNYAHSYTELAVAYFRLCFLRDYPPVAVFGRIQELTARALKLDQGLAEAHAALAAYNLFHAWDWSKAEASSRRAIKLNPSAAWARSIRAAYHLVVGQVEEAIGELQRARDIDPVSPDSGTWFAYLAYCARRYGMAIARCREMIRLDPLCDLAHAILGISLAQTGEFAEAVLHCEKARELNAHPNLCTACACSVHALAGQKDTGRNLLRDLIATSQVDYVRYIYLAIASVGLADDQQTLEWLQKAHEQREPLLVFVATDPRFDSLSKLPRFRKLLHQIGLRT